MSTNPIQSNYIPVVVAIISGLAVILAGVLTYSGGELAATERIIRATMTAEALAAAIRKTPTKVSLIVAEGMQAATNTPLPTFTATSTPLPASTATSTPLPASTATNTPFTLNSTPSHPLPRYSAGQTLYVSVPKSNTWTEPDVTFGERYKTISENIQVILVAEPKWGPARVDKSIYGWWCPIQYDGRVVWIIEDNLALSPTN